MYILKIKKADFALLKLLNDGNELTTADSGKYLVVNPEGTNLVITLAEFRHDYAERVSSDLPDLMRLNK